MKKKFKLKSIEERNAEFQALTPQQKKIAICKDTLALIEANRIQPAHSGYFRLDNYVWNDRSSRYDAVVAGHTQLSAVIDGTVAHSSKCEACAMGMLMCGLIFEENNATVGDHIGATTIIKRMGGIFSENELRLIEAAFETENILFCGTDLQPTNYDDDPGYDEGSVLGEFGSQENVDLCAAAIEFGQQYDDPTKRLVAIINNVIENGTFVPPQVVKV